ncbi:MAG: hypothetical protein NTZ68_00540 [Candidatus Dependentiae bacterium]|nr:hypothetical protein [Candidatus Dependentiae bacterium]
MNMIYKRFYLLFGIVCGFFLALQAGSGTFQHALTVKPVRISVPSQKFLKQIIPDLTLIHSKIPPSDQNQKVRDIVQLCIELSRVLQQKEFLTRDDLSKIQKIIELKKQCLADMVTLQSGTVSAGFDAGQLLKKVKEAFDVTNLRGFEPDARYIKKFLATSDQLHERRQMLDLIANISDIITHFDGVLITDYDVIVLFYTALAVFLVAQTR